MATKILCARKAAVFMQAGQEPLYVLFEQTYQKNEHPRQLTWGARSFGTYQQVLKDIFEVATYCESGLIASKSGSLQAEKYIAQWQKVLTRPSLLDGALSLTLHKGDRWKDEIPNSQWEDVRTTLEKAGRHDLVEPLLNEGCCHVTLERDSKLLADLFSSDGLTCWRLFRNHEIVTDNHIHLPPPKRHADGTVSCVDYAYFRTHRNQFVMRKGNDPWKLVPGAWIVLNEAIPEQAYVMELAQPGRGISMISTLRHGLSEASEIPSGTEVQVSHKGEGTPQWGVDMAAKLFNDLNMPEGASSAILNWDRLDSHHKDAVTDLHPSQLSWLMKDRDQQMSLQLN